MLPHPTQTQILHRKTGLAKAPFTLENVMTLWPLVLQFLQSTKKAEKVKKHRQVIPDSLNFLRITESIMLFNPESHTHKIKTTQKASCQARLSTLLVVLKEVKTVPELVSNMLLIQYWNWISSLGKISQSDNAGDAAETSSQVGLKNSIASIWGTKIIEPTPVLSLNPPALLY